MNEYERVLEVVTKGIVAAVILILLWIPPLLVMQHFANS